MPWIFLGQTLKQRITFYDSSTFRVSLIGSVISSIHSLSPLSTPIVPSKSDPHVERLACMCFHVNKEKAAFAPTQKSLQGIWFGRDDGQGLGFVNRIQPEFWAPLAPWQEALEHSGRQGKSLFCHALRRWLPAKSEWVNKSLLGGSLARWGLHSTVLKNEGSKANLLALNPVSPN